MAVKCPKCGGEVVQATPEIAKCKKCGAAFKRKAPVESKEVQKKGTGKKAGKTKKKGGCLKWVLIVLLILIFLGVGVGMLFGGTSDDPKSKDENTSTKIGKEEKEFKVGETWTVDGQWNLTINSVEETSERNQFEEKQPAAVYKITYTYENLGYEDQNEIMDGLYMSIANTIVDNGGKMGYEYPNATEKAAEQTPIGATCEAQVCIGVDNAGNFKLHVVEYDGNGEKQSAVFNVEF